MHAETIFNNAMQTFELVLKKINLIFCLLFGKIEGSLLKYQTLVLNISINPYKLHLYLGTD